MPLKNTIVVFTKNPVPGRVKTRLIGALSPEQAAEVQRACLADTLQLVDSVPRCRKRLQTAPEFAGDGQPPTGLTFGPGWKLGLQHGPDLGARLERAFADSFAEGARKVVVVGTDTPWMGRERLKLALAALDSVDVVLGPTADGGYYLIGARRPCHALPLILTGIPWGTSEVLALTRRALDRACVSYQLLAPDFDLDRPEDLRRVAKILRQDRSRAENLATWIERTEAGTFKGPAVGDSKK